MPLFSQKSLTNLKTCHPELQVLFHEIIQYWDCTILEGYRNEEDQERAFREGRSLLHYPNGKHNSMPSMAVDAAPYPLNWKNEKNFYFFGGMVCAVAARLYSSGIMKHRLRWGGNWNSNADFDDEKFRDLVHFELKE